MVFCIAQLLYEECPLLHIRLMFHEWHYTVRLLWLIMFVCWNLLFYSCCPLDVWWNDSTTTFISLCVNLSVSIHSYKCTELVIPFPFVLSQYINQMWLGLYNFDAWDGIGLTVLNDKCIWLYSCVFIFTWLVNAMTEKLIFVHEFKASLHMFDSMLFWRVYILVRKRKMLRSTLSNTLL